MADEKKTTPNSGESKAEKKKKEKPPAPEEKPFPEFIEQEYIPALKSAFSEEGIDDMELKFVKEPIPIPGLEQGEACWQVVGSWRNGDRQFNIYFPDENIGEFKGFSWSTNGAPASTMESFMIDERKVDLGGLVHYTVQRVNAQKWLAWN